MKCRNCGSTEVNMYKEIKGIIAEIGITKEDIKREITSTIDSYVRSAMSENIEKYTQQEVHRIVRTELCTTYSPGRPSKISELTKEVISDVIREDISKNFEIKVSLTQKE